MNLTTNFEEHYDELRLWRVTYLLTDKHGSDRWQDFVWSTTPPKIGTPQHYWDANFPGNYTVSELTVELLEPHHSEVDARLVETRIVERNVEVKRG